MRSWATSAPSEASRLGTRWTRARASRLFSHSSDSCLGTILPTRRTLVNTLEVRMAVVLDAAEEPTLKFSFPIEKSKTVVDPATGDVIVYGKATDCTVDTD